jgi:hypothetical protein
VTGRWPAANPRTYPAADVQREAVTAHEVRCAAADSGCPAHIIWQDRSHLVDEVWMTEHGWAPTDGGWLCPRHIHPVPQ